MLCSTLRALGKPAEAVRVTEQWHNTNYGPLLTSRAAALCDLGEWRAAKRIIARVHNSDSAASVVGRIKRARPDLYPAVAKQKHPGK